MTGNRNQKIDISEKQRQQSRQRGFDDILRVDRDQFSIVKGTVKVHFKPISRDGKTRRWWEAKRTIENMHEVPPAKDQLGRKHKSIFIHAYMILEMEEQDR